MSETHGGAIYGKKIQIDFSVNVNPLGIPGGVKEAVLKAVDRLFEYPDTGYWRLRERIAQASGVEKKMIRCGNGAADLIFSLCFACKPEKALLLEPSFSEYEKALKSAGADITYYRLKEADNFKVREDFMDQLTEDLSVVFLCNPNNPTGQVTERDFLIRILKICRKNHTFVVIDECFMDFVRDFDDLTMVPYLKEFDNLVILKAFTKIYSMPGLRLGYLFTGNEWLMQKLEQATQPWSVSIAAEEAGIAALDEKQYVMASRKRVDEEKNYLLQAIAENQLADKIFKSRTNFILLKAEAGLKERLVREGILIRDCSNFRGLEEGFYRIAVKSHKENEELIRLWKKVKKGGF